MSANENNVLRSVFRCGCRKTNLPDVIHPQLIHTRVLPLNPPKIQFDFPVSTEERMSTAFSPNVDTSPHCSDSEHDPAVTEVEVTPRPGSPSLSAIAGSIAVTKESDDPYRDFRDSMLRMILEKGIYSRDGLEDLLRCFLELNSHCYHGVIIRAFSEIWHSNVSDHRRGSWR